MGIEEIYLLNLIITTVLVIATLYRVKIERDMIKISQQNAKYMMLFKQLKEIMEKEKDIIRECDIKEFYEFLKEFLEKNAD